MGRRTNSKKRAIEKNMGHREELIFLGACTPSSCAGDVVACKPLSNQRHTCICTHDSQPPFADGTCPRKVVAIGNKVSDVDESSGRIPVQPIGSHETNIPLTTTSKSHRASSTDQSAASTLDYRNYKTYLLPGLLVGIILIIVLVIFIWKKSRRRQRQSNPVSLKHSFLVQDRYTPNPQYSVCPATGVPILNKETLSFLKEIGEGCFGKVFKGELVCEDSEQVKIVAIKVLKDSANKEAEEDFLREVEIMSAFRHPNILTLLGVVPKDENVNPMMVFEFMPHGDLAELLRCQKRTVRDKELPKLTDPDLHSIALQIAKGMKYLASQRFVHRDLACRNCLVAEGPTVKIADFGMSRDVYTCDYYKIGGSRLLPVRWMSPESVVYGRFTLESDIWSYGIVLWEIYTFGKQPYYGHSNEEVIKIILDGVMLIPPKDCPLYICDLMKNCWKTEPKHRITFTNICEKLETSLSFEKETKKFKIGSNKSLPRPPPLPVMTPMDLLDRQDYLEPVELTEPVTYLETVCD